jgi:hypothetical protein
MFNTSDDQLSGALTGLLGRDTHSRQAWRVESGGPVVSKADHRYIEGHIDMVFS